MHNRFSSIDENTLRKLAQTSWYGQSAEFAELGVYFPFGDSVSLNDRGVLITGNPGGHGKTTLTKHMANENENCVVISHDAAPIYANGKDLPLLFPRSVEELISGNGVPLEVIIKLDTSQPTGKLSLIPYHELITRAMMSFNLPEEVLAPYLKSLKHVRAVRIGKPMGGPNEPSFEPVYDRIMEYLL